jgi:hypothetical protein
MKFKEIEFSNYVTVITLRFQTFIANKSELMMFKKTLFVNVGKQIPPVCEQTRYPSAKLLMRMVDFEILLHFLHFFCEK